MRGYHRNMRIDERELIHLKSIVDEHPIYYLDEIALIFGIDTGKFGHTSTIWRYTTEGLGYSQQVLLSMAKQQCTEDEHWFKVDLSILLQG